MENNPKTDNYHFKEIEILKKENAKLKKDKDFFQVIAESAIDNIAITTFDLKAKYLYVSPSTTKILGYIPEEMLGKSFFDFIHPQDKKVLLPLIRKYIEKTVKSFLIVGDPDITETIEFRFKSKTGNWREMQSKVTFLGKNLLAITRDITEQKKIQEGLYRSEKIFRELFEKSGDAILIIENGHFVNCNNETIRMLKYKNKNEFLNSHPSQLSPPQQPDGRESLEKANEMMNIALKNGTHRFEWDHKKSTGEVFPVEVLLTAISNEPTNKVIHTVWRDITERKKTEAALYETEEIFSRFMDNSPIYVFFKDENIRAIRLSKNYEELLGKPIDELIGKNMNDLFPSELAKKMVDEDMRILKEGIEITVEEELNSRLYSTTKFPIFIEGKPTCLAGFTIDITENKKAEKDIKKALKKAKESDRLKSSFLANMSHEIRTPMNGILGFSNLLKQPNLTGDEQQKFIDIIEKSGERMLNIINDLIDISKIESGQMEVQLSEININNQIEYIYTFFKPEVEKKGIRFLFNNPLPAKEAMVYTDNEKLYAILTNLVKNAIKYTESGTIKIGYQKTDGFFEFYVNDTGLGIPKEMHKTIFDRFVRADVADKRAIQGAGLGLSISKAYVEMLGGKIWMKSELGVGTKFYFTIPCSEKMKQIEPSDKNSSDSGANKNQSKKLKILIVDDETNSDLLLTAVLKNIQKETLHAKTGKEAIDIFEKYPDIDLILMDIRMPEMNGYVATRKIRENNKEVVIIAQTAFAIRGDKEKAMEAGCNDYISKPIKKEILLELIGNYFKE